MVWKMERQLDNLKMKLKKILVLILIVNSAISFSQEMVNSFPLKLKGSRDIFQIANDSIKETTFFVSDRKKVTSFLLDDTMKIKDSISSDRPERKYKDILGFSGDKSNPIIYWSNSGKNEVCAQFFNFRKREISIKEFEIEIGFTKEKYLQTFSENNTFYILTIGNVTNTLNLYAFNDNEVKKHIIDLNALQLYKSSKEAADIYKIFGHSIGDLNEFEASFTLTKIVPDCLSTLTDSAKKRKCYSNKDQIIISLDFNNSLTQLIFIDLKTYSAKLQNIDKKAFAGASISDVKSNSFLIDDKLLQITLTSDKMNLSLKDFNNKIIKEYNINATDEFSIKNSSFVRQNHLGSERELETTDQFLRKIVRSNVGVTCYKQNGNYLVNIGSVSPEKSEGGGFGPIGIGMAGGISTVASLAFQQPINFVGMSFNSYNNRRTIATDCLFDKDLTHINGSISELAFDKIDQFKKKHSGIYDETIYRINGSYYYGYYYGGVTTDNGRFFIYKFTD